MVVPERAHPTMNATFTTPGHRKPGRGCPIRGRQRARLSNDRLLSTPHMASRKVGLLLDADRDGTANRAIAQVMGDFFRAEGIEWDVVDRGTFRASDFSRLVIGGARALGA